MAEAPPATYVRRVIGQLYVAVYYRRRVVGLLTGDRAWYQPEIEALEPDDPLRRFVATLFLVGREMQRGGGAEPYDERKASYYARAILMPDEDFDDLALTLDDAALARHFGVPEPEVEAKRLDRAYLGLVDP